MDHLTQVSNYTHKIIKDALHEYFNQLSEGEKEKRFLNVQEVLEAQYQIMNFNVHIAAIIHNLPQQKTQLWDLITADQFVMYNNLMLQLPELVPRVALITKYIHEGVPHELIINLVDGSTEK